MVLNLEEDNVGIVLLGPSQDLKEGDQVKRTKRIASIPVGEGIIGRVVDTLGKPIDGKGDISGDTFEMPLERKAPGVIYRQPVNEPLQTGIKSIDAMIPIGRGQRELVIGDRQTGKTTVCIDTILNQKEFYDSGNPVYCIYVAIGQKASTVAAIAKVLEDKGALKYTTIVAANASDPAPMQVYSPFAGAAIGGATGIKGAGKIGRYVGAAGGAAALAPKGKKGRAAAGGALGTVIPTAGLGLGSGAGAALAASHELEGDELNELNKQERMETSVRGGGGVGKRFAKKTIAKNKAGTSKRGYDHRGTGNVGRRNMERFENKPVKRKEGSLDKKRRQTFKTVTVDNPKTGYSKKSDAVGAGKKLTTRKLSAFGSDMKRDYGPQKPGYAGNTSRDAAQAQRRAEHKARRGVKTKGTVASDIKKSLKETNANEAYVVNQADKTGNTPAYQGYKAVSYTHLTLPTNREV